MEFSIDVHTTLDGKIVVEDFSKEYGQYLHEEDDVVTSFDLYKYSESASLNVILKVELDKTTLLDVLLDKHDEDIDSVIFNINSDGYYTVEHVILPNVKWYENSSDEYLQYYDTIYLTDGQKVYKILDGNIVECSVREIIDRNPEGTTIKKCHVDVFYTGWLQNCYIDWCKKLFDGLLSTCNKGQYNDAIFARDMIWMTLNIIDYLVGFKQFLEAERILEMFHSCGSYCKNRNVTKPGVGCGCSQR